MKLVQKMSVGLSLVCAIFMSSCSKEDIQTPTPRPASVNENSNLRQIEAIVSALPVFPSTMGQLGFNVYPAYWERSSQGSAAIGSLPTGTSSLTHQWGDPKLPWAKPLPANQFVPGNATILTTTSQFSPSEPQAERSGVKTRIKYLKPGKKYTVLFNVASTIGDLRPGQVAAAYSKGAEIRRFETGEAFSSTSSDLIDLKGKEGKWVTKTIIFTAKATEADFIVLPEFASKGEYTWVNIYVDKTSIKQLN